MKESQSIDKIKNMYLKNRESEEAIKNPKNSRKNPYALPKVRSISEATLGHFKNLSMAKLTPFLAVRQISRKNVKGKNQHAILAYEKRNVAASLPIPTFSAVESSTPSTDRQVIVLELLADTEDTQLKSSSYIENEAFVELLRRLTKKGCIIDDI